MPEPDTPGCVKCSMCWHACPSESPILCAHPACKVPICEVLRCDKSPKASELRRACGLMIETKGGGTAVALCRRCACLGLEGLDDSYCIVCGKDCADADPLVQCGGCDAFLHLNCDTAVAEDSAIRAFAQAVAHDRADWLCERCAPHRVELAQKFPLTVHPLPVGATGVYKSVLPASAAPSSARGVSSSSSAGGVRGGRFSSSSRGRGRSSFAPRGGGRSSVARRGGDRSSVAPRSSRKRRQRDESEESD